MNNTTNNKLFIELLGPAADAQAFARIVPVTGELTASHIEGCGGFFVLRTSELGMVIMGSVLLDEVPNRTDSERGSSMCKYHTERGWKCLFSISCRC